MFIIVTATVQSHISNTSAPVLFAVASEIQQEVLVKWSFHKHVFSGRSWDEGG